jgi:putative DNA primase/helicase
VLKEALDDGYKRWEEGVSEETVNIWVDSLTTDPSDYFDENGLLVLTLAKDIFKMGPIAAGKDEIFWSYSGGVWRPNKDVVRNRAICLLGERYRNAHGANAEAVVRMEARKINADPISHVINFRNGLYAWETRVLLPHSPDVLSTVQLPMPWNPDAECPAFDTFLSEVLHADMIDTVWELIGYLMYSGNPFA